MVGGGGFSPKLVKAHLFQCVRELAFFCFDTHPHAGSMGELVMGLNYSRLLISGKSPLDEFEHASKII